MSVTFERLMTRVQLAKSCLSSCSDDTRVTISAHQRAALLDQMTANAMKTMSREEIATFTGEVAGVPLAPSDMSLVLGAVGEPREKRRELQDFQAFTHYLSNEEWNTFLNIPSPEIAAQYLVDVLVIRLMCINPSEDTNRLVRLLVLYRRCEEPCDAFQVTHEQQNAMKHYISQRWIAARRKTGTRPEFYIPQLPATPGLCQQQFPEHFTQISTSR